MCVKRYGGRQLQGRISRNLNIAILQMRIRNNSVNSLEYSRQKKERSIANSLRMYILNRDKCKCVVCGKSVQDNVTLNVDHVIPVSRGGTSDMHNLCTLCSDCNNGKSNTLFEYVIECEKQYLNRYYNN